LVVLFCEEKNMGTLFTILGFLWAGCGLVAGLMSGKGYLLRAAVILGPLAFFLLGRDD
jgi:hypothetical protein